MQSILIKEVFRDPEQLRSEERERFETTDHVYASASLSPLSLFLHSYLCLLSFIFSLAGAEKKFPLFSLCPASSQHLHPSTHPLPAGRISPFPIPISPIQSPAFCIFRQISDRGPEGKGIKLPASSLTQKKAGTAFPGVSTVKKMRALVEDELFPSTPGKVKIERAHAINRQFHRCFASTSTMFLWALFLIALTASYLSFQSFVSTSSKYFSSSSWGGLHWERQVRSSAASHHSAGLSVLVTGAAGFVGSHCSLALKKRGDGVVGLDNFNSYYDPSLKKARRSLLSSHSIFVIDGDLNDARLLCKLFDIVSFSHILHLAAQAGVRYAIENPASYVHSNIAGLVALLEAARSADPQPAIVWASSSSVYGLNEKVPFSESDRTDQPASLYAATKKAGEEITHTYNHIYGLSITGLRFFTVYGPWGRPDMAYFSFTKAILAGKPITIYRGKDRVDLARDFTYIDDIVRGCISSLDTAGKSTGSGGKKRGPAQYRIFNLGNTSPVTVPTLVSILERYLKVKAKKNVVEMPSNGDVPFTHANITLAKAELGYKPSTNLEAGLKKFVKWYLSYYAYSHRGGRRTHLASIGQGDGCQLGGHKFTGNSWV
ncbi:UDP-glucuronate 4-epimerase 1 [Apostasia shenzhenica]|uniref:UDP-glucuronate 4-epimerase n=1 Tax=Apostasia shenzhenica TaxID=1088818 RepID=A0A2I0APW5_9ASPA|nr:UDP-glucuronate 4-epimerase 1 [Apostasia shenzhenica]